MKSPLPPPEIPPPAGTIKFSLGLFVKRLLSSDMPRYRAARRSLRSIVLLTAFAQVIVFLVKARFMKRILSSDLAQDYVMGRALMEGLSPYLPFPELSLKILGASVNGFNPTASPHTPFSTLVFLPFALLPPQAAYGLWIGASLACAFFGFRALLETTTSKRRNEMALLWASLSVLSTPGSSDLFYGQWNYLQLLLVSLFILRVHRAGALVGAPILAAALALRPTVLPIALYSLIMAGWSFRLRFLATCAVIAASLWAALGTDVLAAYPRAAEAAAGFWHGTFYNQSLTVVPRFLFPQPAPEEFLAAISALGALLVVAITAVAIKRARSMPTVSALAYLAIISPIMNPLCWEHYFIFLFIPLVLLVHGMLEQRRPCLRSECCALSILLLEFMPRPWQVLGISEAQGVLGAASAFQSLACRICLGLALFAWASFPTCLPGAHTASEPEGAGELRDPVERGEEAVTNRAPAA